MRSMDDFRGYLMAEYRHIAEAHFRTIEAISTFFRYYLLIMSAPLTILALFLGLSDNLQEISDILESLRWLVVPTLVVISFVGFFVMLYIINLRMDVILYARTINAVRKHFYDQADVELNTKLRTRVLPQTPVLPSYKEYRYFLPVILSFALFNTFYLTLAFVLAGWSFGETEHINSWFDKVSLWSWSGIVFLPVHLAFYRWYARHREYSYLRSFTLGVDIDGVLNMHRQHFSRLLEENVEIERDPESFTTIPLHECPDIEISRQDEKQVFHDPRYWIEMPMADGAARNLESLRNLNLKVHIFSHRPWPNTMLMNPDDRRIIHDRWKEQALAFTRQVYGDTSFRSLFDRVRLWVGIPEAKILRVAWFRLDKRFHYWVDRRRAKLGTLPIEQFTKYWLKLRDINYDTLTIEQGSEDVADPQGRFRNRFEIARRKNIRFFVEDHLEKAIKLAYICDVVFLLDHPYNRNSQERCRECPRECKQHPKDIPGNIIRVSSWDEIYKEIKRLS